MAWTIDTAFVDQWTDTLHLTAAEDPIGIRNAVTLKPGVRGRSYNVERLGSIKPVAITSRHSDTILTPLRHTRRRLTLTDHGLSEMIDELDEVKMLISPQSAYTKRFGQAYNRDVLDVVVAAMNGNSTAVGADDTLTSVALSQLAVPAEDEANAGVGANVIASGSVGMTMAKLRQMNRVMDLNHVPRDGQRYIAVDPFAIEDLLADSTVISSDFSQLHALRYGTFPADAEWMGYHWIVTNRIPKSGTTYTALAWHKEALTLGIAYEFQTSIDRVPTKWNSTMVQAKWSIGAARVEEELVCSCDYVAA